MIDSEATTKRWFHIFSRFKVYPSTESKERQTCRLDWAKSSWTRWIQIPLFSWITPILSLGNKRTLLENDLNDLSIDDKCSVLLNRVNQTSAKWQGTWHVFNRTFFKDFLISLLLTIPLTIARVSQPLLVRQLVLYIKDESGFPTYAGYLFAVALSIAAVLQAILNQQILFRNIRIGMRIRMALSSAIYKRLLTTNTAALYKTTAAQTVNLMGNDAGKFEELSAYVHGLLTVPLETFTAFGLLWWSIGLPTLFSYAVLFLIVPIQFIFTQ